MKKMVLVFTSAIAFTGLVISQSCKKAKDANAEFIADDNSFKGFSAWPEQATFNGPDPLLGAMAHANNDSSVVRSVYFKDGQDRVNGKFPVGTLIVKHSTNPSGTVDEFVGMAKRGNNFDPSHNDWEYFVLKSDGTIMADAGGAALRGADVLSGLCVSCHGGASGKDYVFSK